MHYWWWVGRRKKTTDQYAEGGEVGFQFWLKRREWRRMPNRERKRVPNHKSDVLKWSLPQGPPTHPRNSEYPSIRGWTKRARRRVEIKQLREVWRSVSGSSLELFCTESGCWLVARGDSRLKEFLSVDSRMLLLLLSFLFICKAHEPLTPSPQMTKDYKSFD